MGGCQPLDESLSHVPDVGEPRIVRSAPGIEKGRSPRSSLAPCPVDAERTPAENMRCLASITDRRDNCLLLTQDAGFLKGSKKGRSPEGPRPVAGRERYLLVPETSRVAALLGSLGAMLRIYANRLVRRASAFCSTTFGSLASLAWYTDDDAPLHLRMQLAVIRYRPSPIQNDGVGGFRR